MTADTAPTLPGLEAPAPAAGALEVATRRTLAALSSRGTLSDADAARMALALELSQIITEKRRSGRMSTIGNDARVLMELLAGLVPEDGGTADDALRQAMAEWAATMGQAAP